MVKVFTDKLTVRYEIVNAKCVAQVFIIFTGKKEMWNNNFRILTSSELVGPLVKTKF